jgi:hypothetical protein
MRTFRKSRLTLALAAALGITAASTVPAQAGGTSPQQGFSPTETGQVLIFPYYTVNDGWVTLFNLTNTTSSALAVKVRFREYVNSRDVLDFTLMLSPFDAWTGWVSMGANGPVLRTNDNSCTSPLDVDGLPLNAAAYNPPFANTGPTGPERLMEGYVELVVMGECPQDDGGNWDQCLTADAETEDGEDGPSAPGVGWLTEHVTVAGQAGEPRDCQTADEYFLATDRRWEGIDDVDNGTGPNTIPGNGRPLAAGVGTKNAVGDLDEDLEKDWYWGYGPVVSAGPLKGNLSLINTATGQGAGTEAMHLDNVVSDTDQVSFVTAQEFPWFLEPTLATVGSDEGPWNTDNQNGEFTTELEDRFMWSAVLNEWSDNPSTGARTDWVVNFPTKGNHTDQFCNQVQANNNAWRHEDAVAGAPRMACAGADYVIETETEGLTAAGPRVPNATYLLVDEDTIDGFPYIAPFSVRFDNGESPIAVEAVLFDREEGGSTVGGTTPSPTPPGQGSFLPFETNVITVGTAGSPLGSPSAITVDTTVLVSGQPFGWMYLDLLNSVSALPAYGFVVKTRDLGAPGLNFGQMMDHGYVQLEEKMDDNGGETGPEGEETGL